MSCATKVQFWYIKCIDIWVDVYAHVSKHVLQGIMGGGVFEAEPATKTVSQQRS